MMNFKNILKEIEQTDAGVYEQIKGRRQVLKSFGARAVAAALPFATGSLFTEAYGKTTGVDAHVQALNFILALEYFAYNYYHTANNTGGLIPANDQPGFLTIENEKKAHITYLNAQIANTFLGSPYTPKNYNPSASNPYFVVSGAYDFTAGGKYLVFSDYPTFVMMAETFEDTFVHGYLGQTTVALDSNTLLALLMQMQCSVARHASFARFVRRNLGYAQAPEHPAPWITNNIPPIPDLQLYYSGEENTSQLGIDISLLPGISGTTPQISATAAFDDNLKDRLAVLSLLSYFML